MLEDEERLSLREAADALRISEVTARRWVKSGKLKAYQPGRKYLIPKGAVDELLESDLGKAGRRSSPEPSLFSELEDQRRRTFVRCCRRHAESRAKSYELSSATLTQEGGVFAGPEGARILFVEAFEEYRELQPLFGRDLAYLLVEDLSDYAALRFSGLAVATLRPLAETVERLADKAEKLAKTEAEIEEVERRRAEMRLLSA